MTGRSALFSQYDKIARVALAPLLEAGMWKRLPVGCELHPHRAAACHMFSSIAGLSVSSAARSSQGQIETVDWLTIDSSEFECCRSVFLPLHGRKVRCGPAVSSVRKYFRQALLGRGIALI